MVIAEIPLESNIHRLIRRTQVEISLILFVGICLVMGSVILLFLGSIPEILTAIILFSVIFFFIRYLWLNILYLRRLRKIKLEN